LPRFAEGYLPFDMVAIVAALIDGTPIFKEIVGYLCHGAINIDSASFHRF
jgi:hypothetical protein